MQNILILYLQNKHWFVRFMHKHWFMIDLCKISSDIKINATMQKKQWSKNGLYLFLFTKNVDLIWSYQKAMIYVWFMKKAPLIKTIMVLK